MEISNKIKEKLNSNKPALVVSGYFDSPNIVEYISSLNVDGIWMEGEHGPIDFSNVPNLSRACDLYGVTSIFRITSHEYGLIYRYLDLGAQGLVIPHVSNKEQALHIVKSAKYFPLGERGMFTSRRGLNIPKDPYGYSKYYIEKDLRNYQNVINLRIFNDEEGKMNKSLLDVGGDILLISQFTLHGSTKKGNRPSFIKAAKPEYANQMYEKFIEVLENSLGKKIQTGEFGGDMKVSLILSLIHI